MKLFKLAQNTPHGDIVLPPRLVPNRETPFINNIRLVNRNNRNAEYIIRIYRYEDGLYSVVCFGGTIGTTLRMYPKLLTRSLDEAIGEVGIWVAFRTFQRGYSVDNSADNSSVPGRDETSRHSANLGVGPLDIATRLVGDNTVILQAEEIVSGEFKYQITIIKGGRVDRIVPIPAGSNREEAELHMLNWIDYLTNIKETPKSHDPQPVLAPKIRNWTDEDKELLDLLSNNRNNLKKYSQSWYTKEVAKNTTDPQVLTEILRRGNNDYVSCYAVQNPNCPPEVLAEVLRRGKEDWLSCNAVLNPNCPSEMLVKILRRGKDDDVSWNAARNPNCPPEMLVEVLRRGKDDNVSQYAAENPNCPPKAAFDWMRATGKITKFDPKKHVREFSDKVEEEDPDIKKIEDLLAGNKHVTKTAISTVNDNSERDWYLDAGEIMGQQLRGSFKFLIRSEEAAPKIYNVWWKGLNSGVQITKHDLSKEDFERYNGKIMMTAREESLKAYRETMNAMLGL